MRQIATLADEPLAHRFADYLLTLQIHTQLMNEDAGQVGVWVRDEDKVAQARQELEGFLKNPNDIRYGKATAVARTLRDQEEKTEKEYQKRQKAFADEMMHLGFQSLPTVTVALFVTSILVTLATNFGKTEDSRVTAALAIAPYRHDADGYSRWRTLDNLDDVRKGEVWRLVTPIFLHLSPLHLGFNMLMLLSLGSAVERTRGKVRFALLVLFLAAFSNVAEYYMSVSLAEQPWVSFQRSPAFGGMSGVLYGLFGYAWMKSRFEPELGLHMSRENVFIMLGWFVLCLFGVVGSIANVAHGAGLLGGLAFGYAPRLWRRPRE